jgi:hypothetical protein
VHERDEEVEPRIHYLLELPEPLHDVRSLLRHDHQTLRAVDARVGDVRVGVNFTDIVLLTVFHGVSRRLK